MARRAKSSEKGAPEAQIALLRLANVEARPVEWLWEPYIPCRMLSMLSGDPGAGKSFLALSLASSLSRGRLLDGRTVEPANTLYLSVENPVAEQVRPRFDALGGDADRLLMLTSPISLADVTSLEAAIAQAEAKLVIVDPIQSYFGSGIDLHLANETRPIMDGLVRLAEARACTFLLLRHLSKMGGGRAIQRGLGSIDLTGAVRSEMLAGSHGEDPDLRAMIHIKSNVGPIGKPLGYGIDDRGCFSWKEQCELTAEDVLAPPSGPEQFSALETAKEWLREELRQGKVEQRLIIARAAEAGIAERTLRRAKQSINARSDKEKMTGPWFWSMTEAVQADTGAAPWSSSGTMAPIEQSQPDEESQANSIRLRRGPTNIYTDPFGGECGGILQ